MRVLKIECTECGSKAIIRKTNRKHRELADIYCSCTDVECGHTFVLKLEFSHTISPSAKTGDLLIQKLVSTMSPEQKQITLNLLQPSSV